MLKVILMLLLTVVSSSAMSEWVEIDSSTEEETAIYADPATIRKSGNVVTMWVLLDHQTAREFNGMKYMSVRAQNEYDCKEEQSRTLYLARYASNMANAYLADNYSNNAPWVPITHGSDTEILWKFACWKK